MLNNVLKIKFIIFNEVNATEPISDLKDANIYYAECSNPRETEFKLIMRFVEHLSGKSFFEVENFSSYFPFANLKVDVLKEHKLTKPTNDNKKKKNER